MHTPNPAAAEASVHRQRRISWAVRGNPKALEQARLVSAAACSVCLSLSALNVCPAPSRTAANAVET